MNSRTATFSVNTTTHNGSTAFATVQPAPRRCNPVTAAQIGRTLARKWDLVGVVALMLSTGAYGVYALACLTGF